MKRICFFHSADKDGHASGAIVANHFGLDNVEMIGINYGDSFPWDKIDKDTEVWMVDFSLQPWERMVRLWKQCGALFWIDHHKSAILDWEKWAIDNHGGYDVDGFDVHLSTSFAACELVWKHFYDKEEMPKAVYLFGRYDIWAWDGVDGALEFQYGSRAVDTWPSMQRLWQNLLMPGENELVSDIIEDGEAILAYKQHQDSIHIKSAGFELEWEGLRWLAINEMFNNSQLFDSRFDPEKHDGMLTFGYRRGQWHFSLYCPKEVYLERDLDMGAVAKKHGGGGHQGAAGFQKDMQQGLPFPLPVRTRD